MFVIIVVVVVVVAVVTAYVLVSPPEGGGGEGVFGALKVLSEPRTQSLSRLGARTKMLFLAKWNSGVKQWNPTAPNFPSWSPRVLHFLGWSPGAVNPFGTLLSEN